MGILSGLPGLHEHPQILTELAAFGDPLVITSPVIQSLPVLKIHLVDDGAWHFHGQTLARGSTPMRLIQSKFNSFKLLKGS